MSRTPSERPELHDFRRRLRLAVSSLPSQERSRLLEQIDAHLDDALSASSTEAEVREVLDDLGSPESIALATGTPARPKARPPYHEIIALVLLTAGSILLPLIGWVAGVVLLWTSGRWSVAQKWLGTLILPGGLLFVVWLGLAVAEPSSPSFNGVSLLTMDALGLLGIAAPILVAAYRGLHIRPVEPV